MGKAETAIGRSLIQSEEEMIARWRESEKPLVSISCTTYNHEPYIADSLDGFLIQRTGFPFEILVHDDASTDGTADVVKKYAAMYPHLIRPHYQTVNQYSQGRNPSSFNFSRARGKYIALCDGDDYWIDEDKLAMQINFFENNLAYMLTYHNMIVIDAKGLVIGDALLHHNGSFSTVNSQVPLLAIPKSSVVFRNIYGILSPEIRAAYDERAIFNLDAFLWTAVAQYGDAHYLNFKGACYRVHSGGVYSGANRMVSVRNSLNTRRTMLTVFGKPFRKAIIRRKNQFHMAKLVYLLRNQKGWEFICEYLRFSVTCLLDMDLVSLAQFHTRILKRVVRGFRKAGKSDLR